MSYVCVPLYETLGETAIEFILQHSEVKLVFIQGSRMGRMAKALQHVHKMLAVIYWGDASEADIKVGCDPSTQWWQGLLHVDSMLAKHLQAVVATELLPVILSVLLLGLSTLQAAQATGNTVLAWQEALAMGAAEVVPADPPKAEDLSTIMYTSGTTGKACKLHTTLEKVGPA